MVGLGAGDEVAEVSAPELAPLFCPGPEVVVVAEEVGLLLWVAPLAVVVEPLVGLLLLGPFAVLEGLPGVVVIGAGFWSLSRRHAGCPLPSVPQ